MSVLPSRLNTLASTATPSVPPTSRIALLAPLALPSSLRLTLERIMFETGAKTSAMPMPASTNGTTRLL